MTERLSVDVSAIPELLQLAEEVCASNQPRVLRRNDEDIAIIMPARTSVRRRRGAKTTADYEAFLSAAGGWKDVDTDKLIADIYESRKHDDRPPVSL